MNELLRAAIHYRELGLSVIATDALKQSLVSWKDFQTSPASIAQLTRMFNYPGALGLAVVTGKVSGNLEVIDIDSKYDLEGGIMRRLCNTIKITNAELVNSLVAAQSRSRGYHFYYRSSEIASNQSLARRATTEEEKKISPKEKVKVLIETRGQGGYIIVPPTPGYRFLQHDFSKIPEISGSERNIILTSARRLNQYEEKQIERQPYKIRAAGEITPLDDYNLRGDVIGLLQKHGWTVVDQTSKRTFFRRPGDTDKRSSGSFNHEINYFSVFSTSTEFTPGAGYRPYAVYAMLECNGDYREAVKRLAKEGFGQSNSKANVNRPFSRRR
ncbi:MAG: bifunctional DNA primase/polymerase [Chitinophagaceae bacterium]|nr:bifunctional DNA primase/polymerase [Chitinophagaceae bacterium]